MNKLKFVLLALIVVLAAILAYLFVGVDQNQSAKLLKCELEADRENCYKAVAIEEKDLGICDQIEYSGTKASCYQWVSQSFEDPQKCKEVEEEFKDSCYQGVAWGTGDHDICKNITDENKKSACFSGAVKTAGDITICEEADNDNEKNSCYISFYFQSKDKDLCEKIPSQTYKDGCYKAVAKNTKDEELCSIITSSTEKDLCLSELAVDKKDPKICNAITGQEEKDSCKRNLGQVTSSSEPCEEIESIDLKDECYLGATRNHPALQDPSSELCYLIVGQKLRNDCFHEVAYSLDDKSLCDEIDLLEYKDICYREIADEVSECEIISNLLDRNYCYKMLDRCDLVEDGEITSVPVSGYVSKKDLCYKERAAMLADITLCEKIESEDVKATCLDTLERIAEA